MSVCIYVCMYVCMYVCVYTHMCTSVRLHVCMYVDRYMCEYRSESLSSCVQHFGREIIGKEMGLPADHATVEKLWLSVYKNFIEVRTHYYYFELSSFVLSCVSSLFKCFKCFCVVPT